MATNGGQDGPRYQVIVHTGNAWGAGRTTQVAFEVFGSYGRLQSGTCRPIAVAAATDMRDKAIAHALSLPWGGTPGGGQAAQSSPSRARPAPPPLDKRNVFSLFRGWLGRQGGHAGLDALVAQADAGGDGRLDMSELGGLLRRAVPDAASIEVQMFMAMVDVNGDGAVMLQELKDAVAECTLVDAVVAGGGDADERRALQAQLSVTVQELRGVGGQLSAGLSSAADARGGFVTFSDVGALLRGAALGLPPHSTRALLGHVYRSVAVGADAPGLPVEGVAKALGLAASAGPGQLSATAGPAALAAGWDPGRGRSIFKLLRYHTKKNRAQMEALFPMGTELDMEQVRSAVRAMQESRPGEPPLSGRELRTLLALLDSNANGKLSRAEFEAGLRDCREIEASMVAFLANPASVSLQAPVWVALPEGTDAAAATAATAAPVAAAAAAGAPADGAAAAPSSAGVPTWAQFLDALKALHAALVDRAEWVDGVVRSLDSRGKGRLDLMETRQLLSRAQPSLSAPPGASMLRALLMYVHVWDPSAHGLLSLKQLMSAFRMQPPDGSLYPTPSQLPGGAGEGSDGGPRGKVVLPSLGTKATRAANKMAAVLPQGGTGLLPDPEQWAKWHGNVITAERRTGTVRIGSTGFVPLHPDFQDTNWRYNNMWMEGTAKARAQPPAPPVAPTTAAAGDSVGAAQLGNSLESRLWPEFRMPHVSYLGSVWQQPLKDLGGSSGGADDPALQALPKPAGRPKPPPPPPGLVEAMKAAQREKEQAAHAGAAAAAAALAATGWSVQPSQVLQGMRAPVPGGSPDLDGTVASTPPASPGFFGSMASMFSKKQPDQGSTQPAIAPPPPGQGPTPEKKGFLGGLFGKQTPPPPEQQPHSLQQQQVPQQQQPGPSSNADGGAQSAPPPGVADPSAPQLEQPPPEKPGFMGGLFGKKVSAGGAPPEQPQQQQQQQAPPSQPPGPSPNADDGVRSAPPAGAADTNAPQQLEQPPPEKKGFLGGLFGKKDSAGGAPPGQQQQQPLQPPPPPQQPSAGTSVAPADGGVRSAPTLGAANTNAPLQLEQQPPEKQGFLGGMFRKQAPPPLEQQPQSSQQQQQQQQQDGLSPSDDNAVRSAPPPPGAAISGQQPPPEKPGFMGGLFGKKSGVGGTPEQQQQPGAGTPAAAADGGVRSAPSAGAADTKAPPQLEQPPPEKQGFMGGLFGKKSSAGGAPEQQQQQQQQQPLPPPQQPGAGTPAAPAEGGVRSAPPPGAADANAPQQQEQPPPTQKGFLGGLFSKKSSAGGSATPPQAPLPLGTPPLFKRSSSRSAQQQQLTPDDVARAAPNDGSQVVAAGAAGAAAAGVAGAAAGAAAGAVASPVPSPPPFVPPPFKRPSTLNSLASGGLPAASGAFPGAAPDTALRYSADIASPAQPPPLGPNPAMAAAAASPLPPAADNQAALAAVRAVQAQAPPPTPQPPAPPRPPPKLSPPLGSLKGHPAGSPPLLLRCQATAFDAPIMSGELGSIEKIVVESAEGATEPWFLEKIEIRLLSSNPPLSWEAHYRGWIHPGAPTLEVQIAVTEAEAQAAFADAAASAAVAATAAAATAAAATAAAATVATAATQQPQQQAGAGGASAAALPAPTPQAPTAPATPTAPTARGGGGGGAVFSLDPATQGFPHVTLVPDPLAWEEWDMQVSSSGRIVTAFYNHNMREWAWDGPYSTPQPSRPGSVPAQRPTNPYASASPKEWLFGTPIGLPRLRLRYLDELPETSDHVRPHYGLGKHGFLGLPDMSVRVCGAPSAHALALHGRGGFRMALPEQLVEQWEAYSIQGDAWQPVGMPGVMEAVCVAYDLGASSAARGEQYAWFTSVVALDDCCGLLVAPVRFSLLLDDQVAWRSNWMDGAQQVETCSVSVAGASRLKLVVETEFSAAARCVWLDPHLLLAPLPPNSRAGLAGSPGQLDGAQGLGRMQTVVQSGGEISFLLPAAEQAETHAGSAANTATYCISVYTADVDQGGTSGQVYVRLKGRKGAAVITTKWLLLNPKEKLDRGTKHDFFVELKDMDVVDELQMEHKPATLSLKSDWCIQHVEVSHESGGTPTYFIASGWFHKLVLAQKAAAQAPPQNGSPGGVAGGSGSPGGGRSNSKVEKGGNASALMLHLHAADASDYYKVTLHILSQGPGRGMGLDAAMQAWFTGVAADGSYVQHPWVVPEKAIRTQTTTLLMKGPPSSAVSPIGGLGELVQVQLSSGAQTLLASRLQCVEVVRVADGKHFLCMGKDAQVLPSDQASALVLPVTTVPHFIVSTHTGRDPEASTDARVYVDLFGEKGQLQDLFLRDTGDTFNANQEDAFFFSNPGIGKLTSAAVSHDDSGASPNWFLERLEVTDSSTGKTVSFPCNKWIGLDKGGADSVLQRTLYPSGPMGGAGTGAGDRGDGASAGPRVMYHLMLQCEAGVGEGATPSELWHAAESCVVAGELNGAVVQTDVLILDSGRHMLNLQVDAAYVQHVQWHATAAAAAGVGRQPQGAQTYEVTATYSSIHDGRADWAGASAPREAALVLHGMQGSSTSLRLGGANSAVMGARPFSVVDQIDTFTVDSPPLGPLLRADIKQTSFDASWGVRLARVSVRDMATGEMVSFLPMTGVWLGASPEHGASSVQGQTLRLLPAGLCVATFAARSVGAVRTLHLRHDSPGVYPGWSLTGVDVFVAEVGQGGTPAPTVAAVGGQGGATVAEAGDMPRLYSCDVGAAVPKAWPSDSAQYIRHFVTADCLQFGEQVPKYFAPPSITTSVYGQPPMPPDPLAAVVPGAPPGLLATDPRAAARAAYIPTAGDAKLAVLDPVRAAQLAEEFKAEEASFREGKSDVFALLRARLRADPALTQTCYDYYDEDKDGRLVGEQVVSAASHALGEHSGLPLPLPLPPHLLSHLSLMVELGSGGAPMGQQELVRQLRACHDAYKRAASMQRMMVASGGRPSFDPDLAGAENALCALAGKLLHPEGNQGLSQAFAVLDKDGSGYLDGRELVQAMKSVEPGISADELRVLLAYVQFFGDTDQDGRITCAELAASLAPFVQAAPVQELAREAQEYLAGRASIFALAQSAIQLQPALLPSLFVTLGGKTAGGGAAGAVAAAAAPNGAAPLEGTAPVAAAPGGAPGGAVATVPGDKLHAVLPALLPGIAVRPEHALYLVNMVLLDVGPTRAVSAAQYSAAMGACVDAEKRAAGMFRMVQAAKADGESVHLDPELGGTELVLAQLAQVYAGPDAKAAESAFRSADVDGSGFLDFRELCAVVKRVSSGVSDDELRLLLSYISDFGDTEKDFKTTQVELVALLQPFMPQPPKEENAAAASAPAAAGAGGAAAAAVGATATAAATAEGSVRGAAPAPAPAAFGAPGGSGGLAPAAPPLPGGGRGALPPPRPSLGRPPSIGAAGVGSRAAGGGGLPALPGQRPAGGSDGLPQPLVAGTAPPPSAAPSAAAAAAAAAAPSSALPPVAGQQQPAAAATRLIAGRGSEGQMARDGIVRGALRDASYLGSTRHVRRLFSDCYGSEETAVAAAAVRVAAAAVDGVSLPVCLAMNLVRFVHDVSGRDRPAGGGVVSASFLNAKPAVGGIGVEPRRGGVLRVLFTVASDAVADTVVRSRRNLRDVDPSAAVFDVLSDREEAQHQALWPAFLAAKAAGKRAQFHRARLIVDGERVPAPAC
ncbi:hypothetical protein FOA52_006321 [Chlamydomonas sp. UWO 241]|nr:hypothetical protein FOA52_006321 [Chlamydomonas sp. UWO 241]